MLAERSRGPTTPGFQDVKQSWRLLGSLCYFASENASGLPIAGFGGSGNLKTVSAGPQLLGRPIGNT